MKTLSTPHIPCLDGWRGLAIVAVLVGHFAGPGFGWLGAFGVALFFVLSGRLMCQLLFIKQVALKNFFFRRFSRILPTFWLYVLVVYTYAAFWDPTPFRPEVDELLSTLFFLRSYLPGDTTILTREWAIGHFWSLNVEEHSYLFLAAGALLSRRCGQQALVPVFLVASLAAALLFNAAYAISPPAGATPWHMRSECASVGILAGATFWYFREHFGSSLVLRIPALFPVLALVLAIICVAMYRHKSLDTTIAPLCLAFCVVFIDRFPPNFVRLLNMRLLRWFGVCSFSLYLWQQPFFLSTLTDDSNRALAFGLSILLGSLSFYLFEDPVRKIINKAWDQRAKLPLAQSLV